MQSIRNHIATIVAGLVVIGVLVSAFMLWGPWRTGTQDNQSSNLLVVVHDGNNNEKRVPLGENATLEFNTSLGRNVVVIQNGAAHMAEADCPHGSCMQQHPISQPGEQIICMPHELWVEVVTEGTDPGTLDKNAVVWNDGQNSNSSNDVDLVAR